MLSTFEWLTNKYFISSSSVFIHLLRSNLRFHKTVFCEISQSFSTVDNGGCEVKTDALNWYPPKFVVYKNCKLLSSRHREASTIMQPWTS